MKRWHPALPPNPERRLLELLGAGLCGAVLAAILASGWLG